MNYNVNQVCTTEKILKQAGAEQCKAQKVLAEILAVESLCVGVGWWWW